MKKILLLQTKHGPYHIARLEAIVDCMKNLSWEVKSVELSRQSLQYKWVNDITDQKAIISLLKDKVPEDVSFFSLSQQLLNTLRKIEPDVVVIAGYGKWIFRLALIWCITRKIPTILLSDSKEDDEPRIWWKEAIKSFLVNKYSSALVGGHPHQRYLLKLGFPEDAIFIGYDVVDNSVFHPEKIKKLPSPIHKPYFLSINRFVTKKNLLLLITAYTNYYQKVGEKAWDLVLCGDGELRPQIEGLIKQYQLENHVHLPGFLQQDEMLPYFAHAQAFIHASTTEQWGLVVNEAMAAGLPVIVSNCCGCFEDLVIEGVNGFGFNPENREKLTNLMMRMSSGEVNLEAMGKASLEQIKKYSPKFHANQLIKAVKYCFFKQG